MLHFFILSPEMSSFHLSSLILLFVAAVRRHQSVKTQLYYLDLLLKQPLENQKLKVTCLIIYHSGSIYIYFFLKFYFQYLLVKSKPKHWKKVFRTHAYLFESPGKAVLGCQSRYPPCFLSAPPPIHLFS